MAATQSMTPDRGVGALTFSSWNVKGLNNPVKRSKVLCHLKSMNTDIIFLQETHFKNDSHSKLRARWIGQSFHSSFASKARGTAVLIRKGVPFKHRATITDKEGRFIIVAGEIFSTPITLVNIYGPNFDDPRFFQNVFSKIPDISSTNLIIGGDFNCVLDPYLDRSSAQRASPSKSRDFLNMYIKNSNVGDVWRLANPTGRDYSFHSQVHNVYTRIDYFLVDFKLIPFTFNTTYHNILISDHSPVTFALKLSEIVTTQPLWRADPYLLKDTKFCEYLRTQLELFF